MCRVRNVSHKPTANPPSKSAIGSSAESRTASASPSGGRSGSGNGHTTTETSCGSHVESLVLVEAVQVYQFYIVAVAGGFGQVGGEAVQREQEALDGGGRRYAFVSRDQVRDAVETG